MPLFLKVTSRGKVSRGKSEHFIKNGIEVSPPPTPLSLVMTDADSSPTNNSIALAHLLNEYTLYLFSLTGGTSAEHLLIGHSWSQLAKMASGKFSIDDAFESDDEDPIRIYGSTTESLPLKGKTRYSSLPDEPKEEEPVTPSEVIKADDKRPVMFLKVKIIKNYMKRYRIE